MCSPISSISWLCRGHHVERDARSRGYAAGSSMGLGFTPQALNPKFEKAQAPKCASACCCLTSRRKATLTESKRQRQCREDPLVQYHGELALNPKTLNPSMIQLGWAYTPSRGTLFPQALLGAISGCSTACNAFRIRAT